MASDDVSTRFPFINLEKAIARAELLFSGDKSGKPMAVPTAFELWSYSPKSSGGFQTISALKMFGLLEDEGSNAERKVRLTSKARRFFLDERDDVRNRALEEFALNPPLFKILWNSDGWSEGIPADTVARSHLKVERGLNDQSSRSLLSVLKETLHYAGIRTGVQADEVVESSLAPRSPPPLVEQERDSMSNYAEETPARETPTRASNFVIPNDRPIIFDMESVTVSARLATAEELEEFIAKLEKLKPLMPSKH